MIPERRFNSFDSGGQVHGEYEPAGVSDNVAR